MRSGVAGARRGRSGHSGFRCVAGGIPDYAEAFINRGNAYNEMLECDLAIRTFTCIPRPAARRRLIIASVATPQQKGGGKPIVALPNPFYQADLGGAVMSDAEPLLVNASAENGFLAGVRLDRRGDLAADDGGLSAARRQPAGRDRQQGNLQKLLRLCRKYDTVLAVDECYARDLHRRPAAGRARSLARDRRNRGRESVPQPRGIPLAVEAVERGGPALRLRRGRSQVWP